MDDKGRLILGTSFDVDDDVKSSGSSSQNFNTSSPADIENTASLDVSLPAGGAVADYRDSAGTDTDPLVIPVSLNIVDSQIMSISLDTRLASNKWVAAEVSGQFDSQSPMTSRLRNRDEHLTIVDMTGQQPGVHHLLKEGGSGFITFENGNRILII